MLIKYKTSTEISTKELLDKLRLIAQYTSNGSGETKKINSLARKYIQKIQDDYDYARKPITDKTFLDNIESLIQSKIDIINKYSSLDQKFSYSFKSTEMSISKGLLGWISDLKEMVLYNNISDAKDILNNIIKFGKKEHLDSRELASYIIAYLKKYEVARKSLLLLFPSSLVDLSSKKFAYSLKWEKTILKGGNTDSAEFEFIGKELSTKEIYFCTDIASSLFSLVSKNKEHFQFLEKIEGNSIYLGEFYPSSSNFIVILAKNKSSSLVALSAKEIAHFESFYKEKK